MSSHTLVILAVASATLMALTLALPQAEPKIPPGVKAGAYQLPADFETILTSPLKQTFSCDARPYGYYADIANNCQIFHICLPIEDAGGKVIDTNQWSFICGNQTVFDQQTLTCNYASDAFPCEESESLYGAVEFGKVDKKE